jgi:hypothetical protein
MENIQLTTQEYLYILVPTISGFVIGLVPLVAGFIKGRKKYAFFGLIACTVSGFILGLILAVPVAVAFVLLIFRGTAPKAAEPDAGGDSPAS